MPGNSKANTRRRILESALLLFARAGFADTSVKAIAEAANVGHGTVFLHFLDKAHLYAEAILLAGDRFLGRMRQRSATADSALGETLDGWVCALAQCDDGSTLLRQDKRTNRYPAISAAAASVDGGLVDFWHLHLEGWFGGPGGLGSERLGELARLVVFAAPGLAGVLLEGGADPKSSALTKDFASAIEIMATSRQSQDELD